MALSSVSHLYGFFAVHSQLFWCCRAVAVHHLQRIAGNSRHEGARTSTPSQQTSHEQAARAAALPVRTCIALNMSWLAPPGTIILSYTRSTRVICICYFEVADDWLARNEIAYHW